MEESELEYLNILKSLMELPFNVGRNLLSDFVLGDYKNKSIINNKLDELPHFDSLNWDKNRVLKEIDTLISNGMIEQITSDYNKFVKVLRITVKGQNEIVMPTLNEKKLDGKIEFKKSEITEEDREKFEEYSEFLEGFNDEQKKAIVNDSSKILCIAGAGSGKTTVLTKRIEFLIKYREVLPERILAITFTRKARQEMKERLKALGILDVRVHTFNSFCENLLRGNERKIYGKNMRVQSYSDKILAINMTLANLGYDIDSVIDSYFTSKQKENKEKHNLLNSFMNDCFSVIDYFKITGEESYDFSKDADLRDKENARKVYQITRNLENHMNLNGLRDYTDQLIDGKKYLEESKLDLFDHVLVDEYQDVNAIQVEIIKLLNYRNIFAVGDPRQAIFGWRGSDIKFILRFEEDFGDAETIHLKKNYRSHRKVVDFMNYSIQNMGLPELSPRNELDMGEIILESLNSEEEEREFIINSILESGIEGEEIFVLARTNRQLNELSLILKQRGINHIIRSDEIRKSVESKKGHVTLATIHAIKGLEARLVFVMGVNENNFPCKASDHPVLEIVKTNSYDREEEERRLFYVAISRAKEKLVLTYSGNKPSYFITDEMKKILLG